MVLLFLFLAAGAAIGIFFKLPENLTAALGNLQKYVIYLLIFFLGTSVGTNEEVIRHLPEIGAKAFLIASLAVAGSVVACMLLSHFFCGTGEDDE